MNKRRSTSERSCPNWVRFHYALGLLKQAVTHLEAFSHGPGGAGAAKEQASCDPMTDAASRAAEWLKQDQERIALDAARVPPAVPARQGGDGRRKRTPSKRHDRGSHGKYGWAFCEKCNPQRHLKGCLCVTCKPELHVRPPSPRPRR